jgi:hypothetical protein
MFLNRIRLISVSLFILGFSGVVVSATTAYPKIGSGTTTLANSTCTKDDVNETHKLRMKPTYYSINVHSLQLCTQKPYPASMTPTGTVYDPANGDAFIKDSCHQVFENTAGSEVEIIDGVNSGLIGTITRPPNNTYPYYLLNVGTEFKFKAEMDFTGASGVDKPYCVTTEGQQTSLNKNQYARCYATSGAAPAPGLLTETKASFGKLSTETFKRVNKNACAADGGCTDSLGVYISDNNERFIANTEVSTPSNIVTIQTFKTPVTVTEKTSLMNIIVQNKKGFLVLYNPGCAKGYNPNKDKLVVGTTSWKVDVVTD